MQSADILLDIKEISILSPDFHKIPNTKFHKNPFRHKPADTYGQTDRYDEVNSRLSTLSERTQTICTLPATLISHSTFRHDSSSNIQARAAICLLAFCCF